MYFSSKFTDMYQRKKLIFLIIFIAILVGYVTLFRDVNTDLASSGPKPKKDSKLPFLVEVVEKKAEPNISYIIGQGDVSPIRQIALKSETYGKVEKIHFHKGEVVKKNDIIITLSVDDKRANLLSTKAKLSKAKQDYKTEKLLSKSGHSSERRLEELRYVLKTAEAAYRTAQIQVEKTKITAPFDGVLDMLNVEVGDYLNMHVNIATIVDNHELLIHTNVPQHEISHVKKGNIVKIKFANYDTSSGLVRFVSNMADSTTRTFRVEISLKNENSLPSGINATVYLPRKAVMSHKVPGSVLLLDENDHLGIKVVNDQNIVEFFPIERIDSNKNDTYVTGLPYNARIITLGQGFVSVGENVRISVKKSENLSVTHSVTTESNNSVTTESDNSVTTQSNESVTTESKNSVTTESNESVTTESDNSVTTQSNESVTTESDNSVTTQSKNSK